MGPRKARPEPGRLASMDAKATYRRCLSEVRDRARGVYSFWGVFFLSGGAKSSPNPPTRHGLPSHAVCGSNIPC